MLIVMRHGAPQEDVDRVVAAIEEMGYQARPMPGRQRTTVGLVGNDGRVDGSRLAALPGVHEILYVTKQGIAATNAPFTFLTLAVGLYVLIVTPLLAFNERKPAQAMR